MTETTLSKWTRPDAYMGRDWHGWFVAPVSRHRDSDILTRSNWTEFLHHMERIQLHDIEMPSWDDWHDPFTGEECSPFGVVRERHFLVGWVEWIAIHPDAAPLIEYAVQVTDALEAYPVLCDEAFSQAEYDEACESFTMEEDDFREHLSERMPDLHRTIEGLSGDALWGLYMAAPICEHYTSDNGGTYVFVEDAAACITPDDIREAMKH